MLGVGGKFPVTGRAASLSPPSHFADDSPRSPVAPMLCLSVERRGVELLLARRRPRAEAGGLMASGAEPSVAAPGDALPRRPAAAAAGQYSGNFRGCAGPGRADGRSDK